MTQPPLGWIPPQDRTPSQEARHQRYLAGMPKFKIQGPPTPLPKGVRICLFDAWKAPAVVQDLGSSSFSWFHQLTGSCVGAGGGNALFSLIATQRLLAVEPTKAFIPFWPFSYGICRSDGGDGGRGEGAMGSWFADALIKRGVLASTEEGLPPFKVGSEGLMLTESLEMAWSDGGSSLVTNWIDKAVQHPLGAASEVKDVAGIREGLVNGYPFTFACLNYIQNATIKGTGTDAAVIGKWGNYGPHQQSVHAYWDNATHGPLYWSQNNWAAQTYPTDPSGGPTCGCWVKEADVTAALRLQAEVYALSHLKWFPAQPEVLNSWSEIFPRKLTTKSLVFA